MTDSPAANGSVCRFCGAACEPGMSCCDACFQRALQNSPERSAAEPKPTANAGLIAGRTVGASCESAASSNCTPSSKERVEHTPGPWKVYEDRHPHYLGGEHIERRIGTEWHHPQMKGPLPIAGTATGLGATEHGPVVHFTSIREADAALMAAAPDLLEALRGVLRVADRATDEFDAARAAIAKAVGHE